MTTQAFAVLNILTGLLFIFLAVPLVKRQVRPNASYGVRTLASRASESDWYRINAIGGRYLVISGSLIVLVGVVGFFLPASAHSLYGDTSLIVTALAVGVPALLLGRIKASKDPNNDKGL